MGSQQLKSNGPRTSTWYLVVVICGFWVAVNLGILIGSRLFEENAVPPQCVIFADALKAYEERHISVTSREGTSRRDIRYRLMRPDGKTPDQEYPLLLFLHGAGQKGNDNCCQLRGLPEQMAKESWRNRFRCFLLAPQCPAGESWSQNMDVLWAILAATMDHERCDRRRVYVTGLSLGGFGCWEIAARHPEFFAAAVPICGGGNPNDASRFVDLPLWVVHGSADDTVPVACSREMVEAIRRAGGKPIYTELPGVGHNSWTSTYSDVNGVLPWMFEQINQEPATPLSK